jgi:glucose/arabinose dehydrogenase
MRRLTLLIALASWAPGAARATIVDPGFTESVLVTAPELAGATGMAWAPDGSNRLFVSIKDGNVRVVDNGVLLAVPFATVTPIYTLSECGLTGLAFDPDFVSNHYLYLFVTVSNSEQQIIRYTAAGSTGTEKTVIVAGLPTAGANHDGGGLGVGPDGKLYWSIGDNGIGRGVNDDLTLLAAKVGRANRDGTVPADNPFSDGAGPNADLIWARGVRNPFTLTFQPATGQLWVNVVGTFYEQIFVVNRGDHAGYNLYENTQPAGFISPVIKYKTNGFDVAPITAGGAVRAAGVATFTTVAASYFRQGEKITIGGVTDPTFNGTFFVAAALSPTIFTIAQPGPDASSGGGTATTLPIGGCVTGGVFYDSSEAPAAYRGNFFFGDYNSGRLTRATLDPATNKVTSVDGFGLNVTNAVDMALGPDGALYYLGTATNAVLRASYHATAAGLVVSPLHLWFSEGNAAVVTVRLAAPPAGPVVVTAARTAGDVDVDVQSGASLTFTPANWSTPQPVTILSAADVDLLDDVASLSITAPGTATETVAVHTHDENAEALVLSATTLTLDEGQTGSFSLRLNAPPAAGLVVTSAASGDGDVTVGGGASLTFTTATWNVPQTVRVTSAVDPDATDDHATITVSAPGLGPRVVVVNVRDHSAGVLDASAADGPLDAGSPDGAAGPPLDGDTPGTADAAGGRPADAAGVRPTDAAVLDAGRDAAGRASDAGCGCRLGGRPGGGASWLAVLALMSVALRKRRGSCQAPRPLAG